MATVKAVIVPFCYDCGNPVESAWKFCPECNAKLYENPNKLANIKVKDSVVSGDITINQQSTNIESKTLKCQNCGSEGNLIISPCDRISCSKKSCETCREKYTGHCGIECKSITDKEEKEKQLQQMEIDKEHRRILDEKKIEYLKSFNEQIIQRRLEVKNFFINYLIIPGILLMITGVIVGGINWGMYPEFQCDSGETIHGDGVYDDIEDCSDGSDEIENSNNDVFKESADSYDPLTSISILMVLVGIILLIVSFFKWDSGRWGVYTSNVDGRIYGRR